MENNYFTNYNNISDLNTLIALENIWHELVQESIKNSNNQYHEYKKKKYLQKLIYKFKKLTFIKKHI